MCKWPDSLHIDFCLPGKIFQEVRQVWQLTTALVLVQLARGDSIAAAKSMQRSFKSVSDYLLPVFELK